MANSVSTDTANNAIQHVKVANFQTAPVLVLQQNQKTREKRSGVATPFDAGEAEATRRQRSTEAEAPHSSSAAAEQPEVVVATCDLGLRWGRGMECQDEAGGRRVLEGQSYVQLVCSEVCDLAFHHPACFHHLITALKQQRPRFKDFKALGIQCISNGCKGLVIEANLHKVNKGAAADTVSWIDRKAAMKDLRRREAAAGVPPRPSYSADPALPSGAQGWTPGWGADASEQDWADEGGYQYEEEFQESPAEASQDEAQDAEAPSEPKKHVPLPEELDARLKAFRRDDDDNDDGGLQELAVRRKMPQNPPPVPHASAAARGARRKKVAAMRMNLSEFVGPREGHREGEASASGGFPSSFSTGAHGSPSQHQRVPSSWHQQDAPFLSRPQAPPIRRRQQADLSTAAFPSLGQAASGTASDDSTAMTVLAALRRLQSNDRWGGHWTPLLLLECLDMTDVLNGTDPSALALGDLLRQVFSPYGELKRLRIFPEQEAAAIEFVLAGAALRAKAGEDRLLMGRKPVRISQLDTFPTDDVIDESIRVEVEAQLEEEAAALEQEAAARARRLQPPLPSLSVTSPPWSMPHIRETALGYGDRVSTHSGSLNAAAPEFQPFWMSSSHNSGAPALPASPPLNPSAAEWGVYPNSTSLARQREEDLTDAEIAVKIAEMEMREVDAAHMSAAASQSDSHGAVRNGVGAEMDDSEVAARIAQFEADERLARQLAEAEGADDAAPPATSSDDVALEWARLQQERTDQELAQALQREALPTPIPLPLAWAHPPAPMRQSPHPDTSGGWNFAADAPSPSPARTGPEDDWGHARGDATDHLPASLSSQPQAALGAHPPPPSPGAQHQDPWAVVVDRPSPAATAAAATAASDDDPYGWGLSSSPAASPHQPAVPADPPSILPDSPVSQAAPPVPAISQPTPPVTAHPQAASPPTAIPVGCPTVAVPRAAAPTAAAPLAGGPTTGDSDDDDPFGWITG